MKDESQIEDMRAAVRGDIERARNRRRSTASPASLPPEPAPAAEPEPRPDAGGLGTRIASLFRRG